MADWRPAHEEESVVGELAIAHGGRLVGVSEVAGDLLCPVAVAIVLIRVANDGGMVGRCGDAGGSAVGLPGTRCPSSFIRSGTPIGITECHIEHARIRTANEAYTVGTRKTQGWATT